MIAYINVFTRGIGYSHWKLNLGFTMLPKYEIKRKLAKTMNIWFSKNKNIYTHTRNCSYDGEQDSWIVKIFFN